MTAPEPAQGEARAAPGAVRLERIESVLRTGRLESAGRRATGGERPVHVHAAAQEAGERAHRCAPDRATACSSSAASSSYVSPEDD